MKQEQAKLLLQLNINKKLSFQVTEILSMLHHLHLNAHASLIVNKFCFKLVQLRILLLSL